jgi:hypothetical protein
MFDEQIKTVEQAKEFFRAMGCSHFHMGRDYPQRYAEYGKLNISKQTEAEWRKEQFDAYYIKIIEATDDRSLWNLHFMMYALFENIRTDAALTIMLDITQYIRDKVPLRDKVIVAETINGRSIREARRGLIYLAYD